MTPELGTAAGRALEETRWVHVASCTKLDGGVCSCGVREAVLLIEAESSAVLREALWGVRTHERNFDGSPCWCPDEYEPLFHSDPCTRARAAYDDACRVGTGAR